MKIVDLALELEDISGTLDFLRVGFDEVVFCLLFTCFLKDFAMKNPTCTFVYVYTVCFSVCLKEKKA